MKKLFLLLLFSTYFISSASSLDREVISLWPQAVPGEKDPKSSPIISPNRKGDTTRIAKVTDPTLTIYEPKPENKNGAAIIICPGGGYSILAVDKEGYEVAEWFSELGYTAFVLQYRVPDNRKGALQDAQRAIRYVRATSKHRGIHPDKIGIMGFSAGGSLSARASTQHNLTLYPPNDAWDTQSARPDFSLLIYPAYLDEGAQNTLSPELQIHPDTPPMFLFVAADDKYANSSLVMSSALRTNKVPFELHILPYGRHGYGMRPGSRAAETWPKLCKQWLQLTVLK